MIAEHSLLYNVKDNHSTKHSQILAYLKAKGSEGATQRELNRICYRYGGRIHDLRKEGHKIKSIQEGRGKWRYYYEGEV